MRINPFVFWTGFTDTPNPESVGKTPLMLEGFRFLIEHAKRWAEIAHVDRLLQRQSFGCTNSITQQETLRALRCVL
jgi:hypothetical protein